MLDGCWGNVDRDGCRDERFNAGSGRVFWDASAATCSMLTSGGRVRDGSERSIVRRTFPGLRQCDECQCHKEFELRYAGPRADEVHDLDRR